MPDIGMCNQHECAIRHSCYRYLAVPSEYQSYLMLDPAEPQEDGTHHCDYYWPLSLAEGRPVSPAEGVNE